MPRLSAAQSAWAKLVLGTDYWYVRRAHLWIWPFPSVTRPLTIFYNDVFFDRPPGNDPSYITSGYIVGEGCGFYFLALTAYPAINRRDLSSPDWPKSQCYYDPLARKIVLDMQPAQPPVAPIGTPTPIPPRRPAARPVYRIVDIGKPGVPALDARGTAWIEKIKKNQYWHARLKQLWFYLGPIDVSNPQASDVPIVFMGSEDENAPPRISDTSQIVGDGCSGRFTTDTDLPAEIVPPTEAQDLGCYYDPFAPSDASPAPTDVP